MCFIKWTSCFDLRYPKIYIGNDASRTNEQRKRQVNFPLENESGKNKPLLATPLKRCSFVVNQPRLGEQKKTVMVLGVERGGTSMVGGVLRALGVNMGERVGFNHEDPQFIIEDMAVLARRIEARNKQSDVWGFKVPKLVQYLDFFEKTLRNPHYVIVYRNLLAIADSWQQRGAGSLVNTLDRTLDYYNRIIQHSKNTRRPVIMVNYERAVSSDAGKEEVVRAVGEFLGVNVDEDILNRAMGMITGDGAGYLNLPEHFFAVTATQQMPQRSPIELELLTPDLIGTNGWTDFDAFKKKLTFVRPNNAPLPRMFWLRVELDSASGVDFSICPLRVYFDYIGAFFPAHCARPPVKQGTNFFLVETSGLAKGLAFGPLQVPTKFKIRAEAFEAMAEDENLSAHGAIVDNLSRPDPSRRR
jgi:hypothetical protein